ALGAGAADVVDASLRGAVNLRHRMRIERRRPAGRRTEGRGAHEGLSSVRVDVVDVEVVELAGGAVAFELAGIGLDAGALQQALELPEVMRRHPLFDAVGAEALDLALNVDARLIERVAQIGAGIAAYH